jgi:hypothetical protein
MPPTALLTASSALPFEAAVTEVTIPESEVLPPSSTAPMTASPRPFLSASTSATPVSLVPASTIATVAAQNSATAVPSEGSPMNGKPSPEPVSRTRATWT